MVPELIAELKKRDANDIVVVVGGVVPERDHPFLKEAGASAVYEPGTHIPTAAKEVLECIKAVRKTA